MLIVAMGQRNRFVLEDQNQVRKRSQSKAVLVCIEAEVVVRKVLKLVEQNSVMRCHSHGPGKLACLAGQIVVQGERTAVCCNSAATNHANDSQPPAHLRPRIMVYLPTVRYSTVPVHTQSLDPEQRQRLHYQHQIFTSKLVPQPQLLVAPGMPVTLN